MKKHSSNNDHKSSNIIVVKSMRDYSKDPAFIRQAEAAKAFIEKYGLPKWVTKKKEGS